MADEAITKVPTGWVDLLTGKPVYKEDKKHGLCPSCGKHSVISDMPSSERCLSCGWSD